MNRTEELIRLSQLGDASAKEQLMKDLAITKAVDFVVANAKEAAKKTTKKAKAADEGAKEE